MSSEVAPVTLAMMFAAGVPYRVIGALALAGVAMVALVWWLADIAQDSEPQPAPHEVEAAHWLRLEELIALPNLLESNRHFLEAWNKGEFTLPLGKPGESPA